MSGLDLAVAGVVIAALTAYCLTAGADFGGGVWDLLAFGPRARAQREVIARAVAPIWEANHVWLIFVIVVLFVCFPPAYATIGTALHVPLSLMLVGIVLRGSAFAFRSHDYGPRQSRWDAVFAAASVVTPWMLGTCVGAIASGTIRVDHGVVRTDFVSSWLAPFPIVVGALVLALFAFLGATYLTLEAEHDALREDFRGRALASGVVAGVLGLLALALARTGAPVVAGFLLGRGLPIVAAEGVVGAAAFAALAARRFRAARPLAMLSVALVLWGWAASQYPYLVVPDLTLDNARSPDRVVAATLGALAAGAVLLVPAFLWLYSVFKASVVRS